MKFLNKVYIHTMFILSFQKMVQIYQVFNICNTIVMKLTLTLISIFFLVCSVSSTVTTPIKAQGTTLPPLNFNSPYRVFNDLMKQSLPIVAYRYIYGSIGRYWNYNLTMIGGVNHQYPASLDTNVYACSMISLYSGIDDALLNQNFTLKFSGQGVVGVNQQDLFNQTWTSGSGGTFILSSLDLTLNVFIYTTNPSNPVNSITILPTNLANPTTFTSNFLYYIKPFNLLRTCYWQGQSQYTVGKSVQTWADRTLTNSASQVSQTGIAFEHILQLQIQAKVTIWPCIPETADSNYIKQMAILFASSRDKSKMLYLEYGNAFNIMNDFPDTKTNPIFDNFMTNYGASFRSSVLFTINYRDAQYYINAMGMRTTPPINFTYIDAIGIDASFGVIDPRQGYGLNDEALQKLIVNYQLTFETIVNRAYQLAVRNGTTLVCWSGGPNLKTQQYGWVFFQSRNPNATNKILAQQEVILGNTLYLMTLYDKWVGELYLHWQARLTSLGIQTIMYGQLVGAFTTARDVVPLLPFLNMTTPAWTALSQSVSIGRKTILPTVGTVPVNPFTCSPVCKWGDCVNNACSCYAGYSGSDCTVYSAPAVQNKIGVNLQGVAYWTTQHPFSDLHKEGSAWVYFIVSKGWSSGAAYADQVPLDANGYPTYLPPGIQVGSLMARDVLTHYDSGTYVILYDGDGILTFSLYDMKAVRYGIGRIQVDVIPSTNFNNGLLFTIERTNPSNYIRNIRVIRPGFEGIWQGVNFSPLLLNKLQPYGTLRFMDWTNTNGQTDVKWADRTTTTARTYTKNGVAWEQVIRLGNTLGKNIWISIPHLADDDYITQLATLVFNTLEPHLTVYVEYSNELWGGQFPGGQYAQAQGILKGYSTDPTQARFCFLGQRTNEISAIWRGVFASNSARLQMIVSTQSVNADTTKRILACKNTQNYVDAVAIAPYLSIPLTDSMTFENLFTGMNSQITTIATTIQTHLLLTKQYNLHLYCYECGQGLTGSTSIQTALQIGVQTSSEMSALYLSYFNMLFNNSIQLVNQYTDSGLYTVYGSWGLFRYTDQPPSASQKWLGLKTYLTNQNLNTGQMLYGACTKDCNGNGVCSFGMCKCYANYLGSNCSISKFVDYIDCSYLCTFNQGTCNLDSIVDNVRTFICTCLPGYDGPYCSLPICSTKCNYNGTCTAPNVCTCFKGMMGSTCQTDCGCGGHGTCNTTDSTCICDSGFNFNTTSKKCQFQCPSQPSAQCYGPNLLICNGCQSGTCNNGTCECWPCYSGATCSVEVAIAYKNSNLGINLGGLAYWSTQHLFKDYFKQSSVWIPQYCPGCVRGNVQYTWNTGASFPTQANGYPSSLAANQSVGKLLLRDLQLRYPSISTTNQYVLLYSGDGIIKLGMDAKTTSVSPGRITFTVTPSTVRDNGIYVQLISTNPSNPVNNIRVILANDQYNYNNDILTASFLPFIQQFSTIRYMDLLGTNGSPVKEWNQTTSPDMDTQAQPSGISIELVAKITNRTGRNIWFNVPHLASDDYVTRLANYLKANVSANRIIYVEYSNEVWNTFFAQGQYAVAQADSLGLFNYHQFYGKRSLQIFNIFSSVFGTNSPRLKFVVSYQAVSQWVAAQIFSYPGLLNVVNVIASAPYYDCNNIGSTNNVGYIAAQPNDTAVIQRCNLDSSFDSLNDILNISEKVGKIYGNIPTATYEAGTSISQINTIYSGAETPAATVNFIAANRNKDMYGIYKKLLYDYKSHGLGTNAPIMIFSGIGLPSKYGSWGLLDYSDQVYQTPTHPKFQAIIDFNLGK